MYGFGNNQCGGFNVWTWIILILIVLQWFRVGGNGVLGVAGGPGGPGGPESGLLNNGGLFIIAIFLLVACACCKNQGPLGLGPQGVSPYRYC